MAAMKFPACSILWIGVTLAFVADRTAVADSPAVKNVLFIVSDDLRASALGFDHLKFFPAEPAGGIAALKALGAPLRHLRFCPTGGITAESAPAYLALPNVLCVGGSWLANSAEIKECAWVAVTARARAATSLAG